MASTNQSPFYKKAEAMFLQSATNKEKLKWLEEMIRECPKHKSSEKMLANLKRRYVKLKEQLSKSKKSGKASKQGIKKADMQTVIVGMTNSGKSSLLSALTNASPEIAEYRFTTKSPVVGIMNFEGCQIQTIENPSFGSEYYDAGLTNSAGMLVVLVESIEQLNIMKDALSVPAKKIIVFNKIDLFNAKEKRKISAMLSSKKYNFTLISTKTKEGIKELKQKIFNRFNRIRVYTKEPGKILNREKPIILPEKSTVKDVAEKILHGLSLKIKKTKLWGPSSKFPGQVVGLNRELKDLDIVEFKTQ